MRQGVGDGRKEPLQISALADLRDRLTDLEEVDEFPLGGAQGCVALDGGLTAARDEDLQLFLGIIKPARRLDGWDVFLAWLCRDDDGDPRQRIAHTPKLSRDLWSSPVLPGREVRQGLDCASPLAL